MHFGTKLGKFEKMLCQLLLLVLRFNMYFCLVSVHT